MRQREDQAQRLRGGNELGLGKKEEGVRSRVRGGAAGDGLRGTEFTLLLGFGPE